MRLLALVSSIFAIHLQPHHAVAHHRPWPAWWLAQATCIHSREGAWPDNTGNSYFGGMQFLRSTWEHAGGGYYAAFDHPGDRRYPFTAPIREQLYRAWTVWRRDGHSWHEWGTAGACGLR